MGDFKVDTQPSSLNILKRYYVKVLRMDEYLKDNVSDNRFSRIQRVAQEHAGMKQLIETAYVCENPQFQFFDGDDEFQDVSILSVGDNATQTEVVNHVLTMLLARHGASNNVLCQGYKRAERGIPSQSTSALGPGFVNVYPNPRVAEVKTAPWARLFKCLGEAHMVDLLSSKSIYLGLKNDFFTQLSGTPLPDLPLLPNATYSTTATSHLPIYIPTPSIPTSLKRKASRSQKLPRKKPKVGTEDSHKTDGLPKAPNAIVFARSRMFYGRPARSLRGKVIFGLRKERTIPKFHTDWKDVLNRSKNPQSISEAEHILKYMFPRQFGLHNVFTHLTDRRETTHAYRDYTDRESEIRLACKDRDVKIYRRLRGNVLPLISKMQKLHEVCSYHALIHRYCSPAEVEPLNFDGNGSFEKEVSKELTQKEIRTISTGTSDGDLQAMSNNGDIIQHHTLPHKASSMKLHLL